MFVAFEGIDGSGKSSVLERTASILQERGVSTWTTREPTEGLNMSKELELDRSFGGALEQFFLFTADRIRHSGEIKEKSGKFSVILTDRHLLSSLAYQGTVLSVYMGGLENTVEWMMQVSRYVAPLPDMTIILEVPVELAIRRISHRKDLTGFEEKEFLRRVDGAYRSISFSGVERIDGSGTIDSVADACSTMIMERIRK
ncbi:MAG: dTMP kinase [Candidatus Thermoplasmatota archaeon]|nr:dTMP kinase [Candidatus Thermoplasmatota archaeon]